jgi:subtilisin family serine protease
MKSHRIWIPILALILISAAFLATAIAHLPVTPAFAQSNPSPKIEPALAEKLTGDGKVDFIVRFHQQADLSAAYGMDWQKRGEYVYNTLKDTAARSQAEAIAYLDNRGIKHQTFIAGNDLLVQIGDRAAADRLSTMPDVQIVRSLKTYSIEPPTISQLRTILGPTQQQAVQASTAWGITDAKADQFWGAFGKKGDGIVVANIDSGVDYTHSALFPNYKCGNGPHDACWYDPGTKNCTGVNSGPCDTPYLGVYHGTHTMGTMIAKDNPSLKFIAGMAPNAQWIACLGLPRGSGTDADLYACADWMLAPVGDPANRPDVVNNSWGSTPDGDNWFQAKVIAWQAAGIFPAFSAGNSGSSCNSMGDPGSYQESFASAAHDSSRLIADFSSRGNSAFGSDPYTKPNISSPGVNIISTKPGNKWATMSGTSMASPHTAGAVALLWSCNPSLRGNIEQTFQALQGNTDTAPAGNCGAPSSGIGNFTFGYGYLDVLKAGQNYCGVVEQTLHVDNMKLSGRSPGFSGAVLVKDQAQSSRSGAIVTVEITYPDNSKTNNDATTDSKGIAKYRITTNQHGPLTMCVTNIQISGFTYDPTQNLITCQTFNIP